MIDKGFIENLKPAELELIGSYIFDLIRKKVTPDTSNHENLEVTCCPRCASVRFVKNGKDNRGKQKYLCRDCRTVFRSTSASLFSRSRISYSDWASFIAGEMNGLTLEAQSVQISRSITTCFHMRHKLYRAAEEITGCTLEGLIELDLTYESINLKGRKPADMPRFSKKRGKNNSRKGKRGVSHHDICILAAVDEHDRMILKIAGLGGESEEKLKAFASCFRKGSLIVSDSKPCILNFAGHNGLMSDAVPSLGGKKRYRSLRGNSLSSVNQLHQEIKILKRRKRGVSTRHLPDYLGWIVFTKMIRYRYEARNRKPEAYIKLTGAEKSLRNPDICRIPMPIDLYKAYGEYHYGIFSDYQPLS